jgi:hypothetical protein
MAIEYKNTDVGKIEFKSAAGGLLALDGELTPAGKEFFEKQADVEVKSRQGGIVQNKAIWPADMARQRVDPAVRASLTRSQALARDVQGHIDRMKDDKRRPTPANHPVIQRALRTLATMKRERGKR